MNKTYSACFRRFACACLLATLLHPALSPAQTAEEQSEQITLNFQDVDIRALINTVSEVTGRNFIVDPRVKGKVTRVSRWLPTGPA